MVHNSLMSCFRHQHQQVVCKEVNGVDWEGMTVGSCIHSESLWTKFVPVILKAKETAVDKPTLSEGNC